MLSSVWNNEFVEWTLWHALGIVLVAVIFYVTVRSEVYNFRSLCRIAEGKHIAGFESFRQIQCLLHFLPVERLDDASGNT